MSDAGMIREHMAVLGADGGHVGTVDGIEDGQIRLTRGDDPGGTGEHRYLPLRLVAVAEAGEVRLTVPAQDARAIAFGALLPDRGVDDDGMPPPGPASNNAGAGVSDMVGQEGGGSGMVHGGGTSAHGGLGGGDGKLQGGGTGGGGTTRHGHLGSGPGLADDPNMDPRGGEDPAR